MQGLRCSVAINRLFCDLNPWEGHAFYYLYYRPRSCSAALRIFSLSHAVIATVHATKMATITNGIKSGVLGEPYEVHVEAEDLVYSEKKGTQSDERDMYRMGKAQQLRRNFRFFTIFGFLMVLMATWEGQLTCVLIS